MALQIRRGTDLQRSSQIFNSGELIYTTDQKHLWIGDGSTTGGTNVHANAAGAGLTWNPGTNKLDLNSSTFNFTTNDLVEGTNNKFFTTDRAQDAAGTLLQNGVYTGISFSYNSTTNTLTGTVSGTVGITSVQSDTTPTLGGNLTLNSHNITGTGNINITGSIQGTSFSGNLTGNVLGNLTGNITGTSTITSDSYSKLSTITTSTVSVASNVITVNSTTGMVLGMPITFTLTSPIASTLGNIVPNRVYFIKTIAGSTLTISTTYNGPTFAAGTDTGVMNVTANGLSAPIVSANDVTLTSNLNFVDTTGEVHSFYADNGYLYIGNVSSPNKFILNTDTTFGTPFLIKGVVDGSTPGILPSIKFGAIRGSLVAPQCVQDTNPLAVIKFDGYTGSTNNEGLATGYIIAAVVSDTRSLAGRDDIRAKLGFGCQDDITNGTAITFETGGKATFPILKVRGYPTASYPSPAEAGMIIFNSDTNHFYGYDGTSWKQLDN
ncbi:MAG: hypothetical protein RLZZ196_313 [Bacteroidota bacterium]|jgi:hypothetical protein